MMIKEITLPDRYVERQLAKRCARKVATTSTAPFGGQVHRCARVARYDIDGVPLCKQHAGEAALEYLIKRQRTKEFFEEKQK